MTSTLFNLQTPELILDQSRLLRNIDRMAAHARAVGVPLRPHLKTPKSVDVANLLQQSGAQGFCVSTLLEAEYFYEAGIDDLYYCVPFAPNKAKRAAALVRQGCKLTLMTDTLQGAEAAITAFEDLQPGPALSFTIEIDVDGYRSGASCQGNEVIDIALRLDASAATRFSGIMSYAGASYAMTSHEAAELAKRHVSALSSMRARLEAAGLACDVVSLGSTPAVLHAETLEGVTEARCGIYLFQDLFQAGIGACDVSDVAVSVLTCVIGQHVRHNRFVIDAGGLALSKDRSTAGRSFDAHYGLVCDAETGNPIEDLVVAAVSQELGLVSTKSGKALDLERFPVGRYLRILPNHADMTAAAYEKYVVVDGGARIKNIWPRANRWGA